MYCLKPTKVFALDVVKDDADALERMTRVLSAIGVSEGRVSFFSRKQAYDVAREIGDWPGDSLAKGACVQYQRPLVFTSVVIGRAAKKDPLVARRPDSVPGGILEAILGYITLVKNTHSPGDDKRRNMVCWNTQDFGVMTGCPHGCQYCGDGRNGKFIAIGCNINEYMEKVVGPVIEKHPGQKCFRMIGWGADIITFEPEYGVFASFLTKLAQYENHYGYFHTSSDNVGWVKNVPHRDRLIGVWSLASGKVSRVIEPGSPTDVARIEAAAKCEKWGVPVRFKLKPVIPVRGWREDYARTIRRVFERTRPETIGFCVIMWMDFETLGKMLDLDVLDPEYVDEARKAAGRLKGIRVGPFPHHVRAQIYRFLIREVRRWDRKIPVYISTESRQMWYELKDELRQDPRRFVCGCNPIEAPGPKMLRSKHLCRSTYFYQPQAGRRS